MADHEASTMVDVAPNILFDYLSDIDHLPEYLPWLSDVHRTDSRPVEAQGLEARRPQQPVHEEVEVTADLPTGGSVETKPGEAWIEIVEENRRLRWGAAGGHDYHGELDVDFVADGTSRLTVRLHTTHSPDQAIDDYLHHALKTIKTTIEHPSSENTPQA
jgi:uncharacterized protein YndB with AHSA1/START domain